MTDLLFGKKYVCPKCKGPLKISINKQWLLCDNCGSKYSRVYTILNPDVKCNLGNVRFGNDIVPCSLQMNSTNGKLAFRFERDTCYGWWAGPYDFGDISFSISCMHETIYKTNGLIPLIVGGVLFGGAGAIGGGIASGKVKKEKINEIYTVSISTNDLQFSGVIFETTDKYLIHDLATKAEIIRKAILEKQKSENLEPSTEKTIDAYDELRKLKALFDDGIIDEETYLNKKKKYLDKI